MANGDKHAAPEAPKGVFETDDPIEVIGLLLFFLVVGGIVFERVVSFARGNDPFFIEAYSFFLNVTAYVIPVSILVSAVFIFGIYHSIKNLTQVRRELNLRYHSHKHSHGHGHGGGHDEHAGHDHAASFESEGRKRWRAVLGHVESTNPSDWKIAIMEADIMLEEMVDQIGYPGGTLGEKLKNVERSDFTNLEKAWEAHKIRNTIAHEGANFTITQEEAKRVIGLFEEVFKEFKSI